jgi:hypothetical protein
MKSKVFQAFQQKLQYFDDDIELIDALRISVLRGDLTDPTSSYVVKSVDPASHPHLARRQNSDGSRKNTIYHLLGTVYSSYVKDVYEEVTHYLRTILEQASLNGFSSGRIVGDHSFKIDAKTVLALGSWESMCQYVTESVFQSLEAEKSTLKLIDKIAKKLDLEVSEQTLNTALPYLEVRHYLVHTDGRLPNGFVQKYPQIRSRSDRVELDYAFISDLGQSVTRLVAEIDAQVVLKNLLRVEDMRP